MPGKFPPQTVTIVRDTNEKGIVKFPQTILWYGNGTPSGQCIRILVTEEPLNEATGRAGDYAIKGHERLAAIERKSSKEELVTNLFTKDRWRFDRAIARLAEIRRGAILLDMPADEFDRPSDFAKIPTSALDGITAVALKWSLDLIWFPRRGGRGSEYRTGDLIARWLIGAVYQGLASTGASDDMAHVRRETSPSEKVVRNRRHSPSTPESPRLH